MSKQDLEERLQKYREMYKKTENEKTKRFIRYCAERLKAQYSFESEVSS